VGNRYQTIGQIRYLIVIVDHFSSFSFLKASVSKSAEDVAQFLKTTCYAYGSPKTILSDQGKEFKNSLVRDVCTQFSIHQEFSVPYHPTTLGSVERKNRDIGAMLKKLVNGDFSKWESYVESLQYLLNTSLHSRFDTSPYFIFLSRHPNQTKFYNITVSDITPESDIQLRNRAELWNTKILPAYQMRSEEIFEKQRKRLDKSRRLTKPLPIGTKVLIPSNTSSKTDVVFLPHSYVVDSIDDHNNYILRDLLDDKVLDRGYAIEQLRVVSPDYRNPEPPSSPAPANPVSTTTTSVSSNVPAVADFQKKQSASKQNSQIDPDLSRNKRTRKPSERVISQTEQDDN